VISSSSAISKNESVPWRMIEGEAILVNVEKGNVMQLNDAGAFIWDHIDGHRPVSQIVDSLSEEFDADKDRIRKDALEFLGELRKRGLIKIK